MTALMCLLLCSAPAFESEEIRTRRGVFALSRKLQSFVAALYYWPSDEIDGVAEAFVHTEQGRLRHVAQLVQLANSFVNACDAITEVDEEAGTILD